MCESGSNAWGYLVPILVAAIWGGVVFAIFRNSDREDWPWLAGLLFACMAIGILLLVAPEGFDGNGDYLGRFFLSVGVSVALGLGVGLVRKRATLRSTAIAIAGDVFLPGLMILALIWFVVGAGHCLD